MGLVLWPLVSPGKGGWQLDRCELPLAWAVLSSSCFQLSVPMTGQKEKPPGPPWRCCFSLPTLSGTVGVAVLACGTTGT